VQNNHQRGLLLMMSRHKREHPERARIGAEPRGFDQWAARPASQASYLGSKAIECVQLWQTSQEFDIFGE
jgi:hypothetical protein